MATQSRDDERRAAGRERIRTAAYELFSRDGTSTVGVDAVVSRAGAAKMTLYRNFASKDELILDFLALREQRWTRDWLQAEVIARAESPRDRLLAIFDVFGEWFATPEFDGCAFLNTMVEIRDPQSSVRQASIVYLANIRAFIAGLVSQLDIAEVDHVTRQWHILMKGSIMAAHEGDTSAAARAQQMGALLLREHGIAG